MGERKSIQISDVPKGAYGESLLVKEEVLKENESIENVKLKFSSLVRLAMKGAKVKNGDFLQCVFDEVYARHALFENVNFSGSYFKNCNFSNSTFYHCDLSFCKFEKCDLPYKSIMSCLPSEPNIRRELARSLKVNYQGLGNKKIADIFLDIEIEANEQELMAIFKSSETYYKQRYDWGQRFSSLFEWGWLKAAGLVWGYGHRILRLIISYLVLMSSLSILLALSHSSFKEVSTGITKSLTYSESFIVVYGESIKYPYDFSAIGTFAHVIIFIVRLFGIIYLGLFGATLYRRISK
jgi:hypothetical protein